MIFSKKTFRYYYWVFLEFIKKHLRIIMLSFLTTFIIIIGFISFSPYIETIFFSKKTIIGMVGNYDFNNLPEEITSKISSGLIFINAKGEIVPALASTWETPNKGKDYQFRIRDGLIWSDGKTFNAHDVNYQFKDIETKVIDDRTIRFNLNNPLPIFPTYLKKPVIKYPLLGVAGLYKVEQIKTRYGYINDLLLNPNKKDLPIIKYKFYNNESDLISAYKRGEINQMSTTKKSVADTFQRWNNTSIVKTVDYNRLMTLFFNMNKPFLKQKEIRQAVIMSINKSAFKEFGEIALGPISPVSWAFNPDQKNSVYDAEAALKIIRKETTASQSAQLDLYTFYDYLNNAEQVVNDLKKAGLQVNINLATSEKPDNFDLLLAFWNFPSDPDQYFFWHSTQTQGNLGGYNNVKIDKLLEDGRNTFSTNERKKIYYDFQKIIADDPPAAFLYFPYVYTIKRK